MASSKTSKKSTYASWIRYFDEGEGNQGALVLDVLLSYWLSWFVLPIRLEDDLNSSLFPLAILLVKGEIGVGIDLLWVFAI